MSKALRNSFISEKKNLEPKISKKISQSISVLAVDLESSKKKLKKSSLISTLSPYAITKSISSKIFDMNLHKKKMIFPSKTLQHKEKKQTNFDDYKKSQNNSFTLPSEENYKISGLDSEFLISKLRKNLDLFGKNNDLVKKSKIISGILDEVIGKDKIFEGILSLIKNEYNKLINQLSSEAENLKKISKESQELKILMTNEAERLYKEKTEALNNYNELHEKYTEIYDKFIKITQIDLENIDQSQENWVKVIQDNRILNEAIYNIKSDLKYYKTKASRMMRLVLALEEKGFPVEEVYNSEIKKQKKVHDYKCDEDVPDDTDAENIVSAKKDQPKKNLKIPVLNFGKVEPNSFSSDNDDDEESFEDLSNSKYG